MKIVFVDCVASLENGVQAAIGMYADAFTSAGHAVDVFSKTAQNTGKSFKPLSTLASAPVGSPTIVADVVVCCGDLATSKVLFEQNRLFAGIKIGWIFENVHDGEDLTDLLRVYDAFAFVSDWLRRKYVGMYDLASERALLLLRGVIPVPDTKKKPIFACASQIPEEAWRTIADRWADAELHVLAEPDAKLRELPRVFTVPATEWSARLQEAAFFVQVADSENNNKEPLLDAGAAGCLPIVDDIGHHVAYLDSCLQHNDSIADQIVAQANKYMELFVGDTETYTKQSGQVREFFTYTRDYNRLAEEFLLSTKPVYDMKIASKQRLELAKSAFEAKEYNKVCLYLENCVLFESSNDLYSYNVWLGASYFFKNHLRTAIHYFERAYKYGCDFQLCVNLILCYEKLNNVEKTLYWCEKSFKYKVDIHVLQKIFKLVKKASYFEQIKWCGYIVSLWNNNVESNDWTSMYVMHGTLLTNAKFMTLKHEEGMELSLDMVSKGLAFATFMKIDLSKPSAMRSTLEKLFSNLLMNANYCETNNPKLFAYAQQYNKALPPLTLERPVPAFQKIVKGSRPIRIGFITGDLINHPVSYVLNGIIEHFDKTRFETHIFSTTTPSEDDTILQKRIRYNTFLYYDLAGKPVNTIVDTIVDADIDILIEMTGHTSNTENLLYIARYKPARVLANYFAYPNTYGIDAFDYKIGDNHVFPLGLDQYYYESFCKVEGGCHTYKPIMDINVTMIEHKGIIFGCTNNSKKFRPAWIKTVSRILNAVPDSRLKMRYFNLDDPSVRESIWKEFEKNGINRSRIDMDHGYGLKGYFSSYADMDICLDPFPYNGGTINIETLYVGLPYITMIGNNYVSRVGASILHQVGHPELIAKSEDEYVEKAVALANDPVRLQTYKDTLRADMMKSTLGDNAAFTRKFEDACIWMLEEKKWFSSPRSTSPKLIIHE